MKRFLYIFLSWCMLLQAGHKSLLLLNHQVNKDIITEMFCINRNKPELNCQGSCHLEKKLKLADTAEKQQTPLQEKQVDQTLFFYPSLSFNVSAFNTDPVKIYSFYYEMLSTPHIFKLFHPPALV